MKRKLTPAAMRNQDFATGTPLPPLEPYRRCRCGACKTCKDNEKWDRIFAKFELGPDEWETRGFFQSTLRGY